MSFHLRHLMAGEINVWTITGICTRIIKGGSDGQCISDERICRWLNTTLGDAA